MSEQIAGDAVRFLHEVDFVLGRSVHRMIDEATPYSVTLEMMKRFAITAMREYANHLEDQVRQQYDDAEKQQEECRKPLPGWRCTRGEGHTGPCAALRDVPAIDCPPSKTRAWLAFLRRMTTEKLGL